MNCIVFVSYIEEMLLDRTPDSTDVSFGEKLVMVYLKSIVTVRLAKLQV